ncbi:hypothetical protein ncot_04005 [Nocardioides sp. JQ2195]|uniref:hypothetical protein n=1 Tax=Nocardioides sp. JQ2195 TaxID=2592334 RepID=UPI00143E8264|nr:hypothetical protein [Nocardioides sp. JQ2195]QIX25852.1 hypothetical protein ncot_04005 [Nocardioides sp. JQ2195]
MHDPAEFDAFYAAARDRLLLQTYALTGDLPAARGAVRDAFVAAWHHWRKVSRLEDPETWVRPHAWTHAQRRHTTRIWHRDKQLDDETRATLDALSKLTLPQRRALLLNHLCTASMEQMARELGLTDEAAARELQTATAQFALHRDVPSTAVRFRLEALVRRIADVRFPRATIIRRTGATRRRAHTAGGVLVAIAAVLGSGAVVHQAGGASPALGGVSAHGDPSVSDEVDPATRLQQEDLLTQEQVGTLSPGRSLRVRATTDNTGGNGIHSVCQAERFADPKGQAALVRKFRFGGDPKLSAVQSVELSDSPEAALRAFRITIGWYSECTQSRPQLLATHALRGVGDNAVVMVLRTWDKPVHTYTVAVARTGSLVTSVVRRFESDRAPRLAPVTSLAATAVNSLCDHESAGACATEPSLRQVPPPVAARAPGLLQEVDLPPVNGVEDPWVGTEPADPSGDNNAATRCDRATFDGKVVRAATSRTFVIPEAKLPTAFGLTETVGRFRKPDAARAFVAGIRTKMEGCEDKDLSTEVLRTATRSSKDSDLTIWHLTTEISDDRTVQFLMAVMRRGKVVVQLGFVPDSGHSIGHGAFHQLSLRALDRVANLPRN